MAAYRHHLATARQPAIFLAINKIGYILSESQPPGGDGAPIGFEEPGLVRTLQLTQGLVDQYLRIFRVADVTLARQLLDCQSQPVESQSSGFLGAQRDVSFDWPIVPSRTVRNASPTPAQLVKSGGVTVISDLVPSQFNARTVAEDGTLIVYNSMLGSISGFPPSIRPQVEEKLRRKGFRGNLEGLNEYLYERGYLVPRGTDEFQRVRMLFGKQHYRQDKLELILLASEECNFRCIYCYETFPRATMEPWVRAAIAKMVETRAPRLKQMDVSWFGGEPLLGYEAIEELGPRFLEIAEKHGIYYSSRITTNGYLLTPDTFANLLKWNITNYQITIDGIREDHDRHRVLKGGGNTFDVIFDNLKEIRKFQEPFSIRLRVNFDKDIMPRIPEYIDMVKEHFSDDQRFVLRFYPIGKWGGANDDTLDVCGFQGERTRQTLELEALGKGVRVESKFPYMQPQKNIGVCYASRPYNLLIGADGKIMKCTIVLDTKDFNVVGHMTPEGIANINIDKLAKWVAPYFEDDAMCRKCFYVPVCQGTSCSLKRIDAQARPCPPEKIIIRNALQTIWTSRKDSARQFSVND